LSLLIKFGNTNLPEAKRLNYFLVLSIIKNAKEIERVLSPETFIINVNQDEIEHRIRSSLSGINFSNDKTDLPLLIYDEKEKRWSTYRYDSSKEDGEIRVVPYKLPYTTLCAVCGITKATGKIYQDVSLRADYRPKYSDPLDREQITGVCHFCGSLSINSRVQGSSVWALKSSPEAISIMRERLNNNIFGLLAYSIQGRKPWQYIFLPVPVRRDLYQESVIFRRIFNRILMEDFNRYMTAWCREAREIEYPHIALTIINRYSNVNDIQSLLIFIRGKRAYAWSLEKIIEMKQTVLKIIRFIVLGRARGRALTGSESRRISRLIMALTDNRLNEYYSLLGTETDGGALIKMLVDKDSWKSPSKVAEIEKYLLSLDAS
jgi:hypothetical protein